MMLLSLSVHDEMSTKGVGIVLTELLFEVGLLTGTADNDWNIPVDVDNALTFLAGDALTMSNLYGFVTSLVSKSSHVFDKPCE